VTYIGGIIIIIRVAKREQIWTGWQGQFELKASTTWSVKTIRHQTGTSHSMSLVMREDADSVRCFGDKGDVEDITEGRHIL
jgi:hypothetical protein